MAVIKVFVGDKDIVVYRFSVCQVFIEQIWVKRDIDVPEAHVKCPASPPSQKYVIHLAIGYWLSVVGQETLGLVRNLLLTADY